MFCSSCGKEMDGEYCSNCGQGSNPNTLKSTPVAKRSKAWYLAPVILGIVGGLIAYFVLRNSDSRLARNCLIVGIGITIVSIAISVAATSTVNNEQRPEPTIRQEEIPPQKEVEEVQSEDERQDNNDKFDPATVSQSERSIPAFINLFNLILDQCNAVNSYSDYLVFITTVSMQGEEFPQTVMDISSALLILELSGYDEHPTVGPLISETRYLAGQASDCMTDVADRYEN